MRPIRALIALLMAMLLALPAAAQTVTSRGPDSVSVAIYRGANGNGSLDLDWLEGYALISEKRTVRIPAGRSVIRFEGVASGIFPESAIITGLPDGVLEKNLDADLLGPRSLFRTGFGRPVLLSRRNADGTLTEQRAIIRSGPEGAAVFETKDGFITADCNPGVESIVYESVPEGLSAKPTLSIQTNSPVEREVTIALSYLAWGFDWQVNYVATMRPDGKTADLVAWVTLASGDMTSFADAETMVIGGAPNREERDVTDSGQFETDQSLKFQCLAKRTPRMVAPPAPPDAFQADALSRVPGVSIKRNSDTIVDSITAEDLGDLKLYRVPERTTVASNAQKQVVLFNRPGVPVELIYVATADEDRADDFHLTLRLRNEKEHGLGIPLPRGNFALFEPFGDRSLLAGEGGIYDRMVGERIDIDVAQATQVSIDFEPVAAKRGWENRQLVATNANPYPVRIEVRINYRDPDEQDSPAEAKRLNRRLRGNAPLTYRGRDAIWAREIPANSTVTFRLRE